MADTERWWWGRWVSSHADDIVRATVEHVVVTGASVALGAAVALPLATAWRRRPARRRLLLGVGSGLYAVPSLALFALLVPVFGLSRPTVVLPMAGYSVMLLARNALAGFDGADPAVLDAADGLGLDRRQRLARVELPLATPAILAGVRLAVVSTIGLATVAAVTGLGGLGQLIVDGLRLPMRTAVTVGAAASVGLAIAADLVLAALTRRLTPWVGR